MRRAGGPPASAWCWRVLLACALLRAAPAHAHASTPNDTGICSSLDIRNSVDQFNKLRDCRIIEGQLSIVLMERTTYKDYVNMTFPNLTEVTGYVLIYRTKGIRNLGDMFPNLTVVRGMELFKDFAFVVFDNGQLEALGLRSLMSVTGGVRIERNDRLCYVNTIDWSRITDGSENIIRANYDTRFCGLCPHAHSRTKDSQQAEQCPTSEPDKRLLCWDENHCQQVCPPSCEQGCLDNRTCCHPACLGGCSGPTARDCKVCRNFSFQYGAQRVCVSSCPNGTFELFSRCVTEQECRNMPLPQPSSTSPVAARLNYYKITDNKRCEYMCPPGYTEQGTDRSNALCVPCEKIGGCVRECSTNSVKIDSLTTARQYTGCTHIKGKLEISIRAGGGNTLVELEKALGDIQQITGGLYVTRSYPLVSLMFLKSLRSIKVDTENKSEQEPAVHILNNPNLELLWDWKTHGPLNITGGLYVHLNPKLCYNQLLPLKNMTYPRSNFTDIEVSADSNGNQASCLPGVLQLKVTELRDRAAVMSWTTYCPDDIRKLLGYSLYHMPAKENITLYDQRDACSDNWFVIDIPFSESTHNMTEVTPNKDLNKVCKAQPQFSPINFLSPYTRYAAYVKTYTTLQDKNGAQSPIIYFTTLPGRPSPPQNLGLKHLTAESAQVRWSPPAMPNGTIILYHVEVQANSYNREQILAGRSKDTCTNPTALANLIASRVEEAQESEEARATGEVANGTCACRDELRPTVRFSVIAEEERMDSIHFENELQNWVYKKNSERLGKLRISSGRIKRSVDRSLNKMLVKLTKNVNPKRGATYTNTTDNVHCSSVEPKVCIDKENDTGYVNALYYELDGSTLSVEVTGLRHFTWYTASVWACRSQADNETKEKYDQLWCSDRQFYTFLTPDLPNVDTVSNVRAQLGGSNKTNDVNLTWDPPLKPNGFVMAYSVTYTKIQEDNAAAPNQNCVLPDEYEPTHGHVLRALNPGNYSIRVTPITVRGPGNSSHEIYIDIPAVKGPASYEWVWAGICGFLIVVLIGVGIYWYAKRGLMSPREAQKLFASVNPEYVSTVYVPDEWEVPRTNVEFIRELGQGSFGMVYEGIAKDLEKGKPETRCAVKTVNEHATDRERIEFLNEASVMKAFDTFHVVRLLGVVSRGQPTLVVMELMECGDLKTYLRSHRPDAESSLPKKEPRNEPPTLQNILQMAIEIADGMAYLSAKKFVHRDLAARNCMVAGDLTVKVGDFGMTRDIYETDYYRKGGRGLLPVRWMSPESLKDGVFSSSSDVWSFGVVLWEMATLAMQPYQGLSNEQVVRYVVEGGVMERPEHCPDRLYELMRACWAHRPATRPSFLQLVADLAPSAQNYFRHRSFFHSPLGQEMYALQRTAMEEEVEEPVNVGAVATGSGSNLFGVSGRLASWVRELSSLRSRASDDAAAEPLQPLHAPAAPTAHKGPNGVLRDPSQP